MSEPKELKVFISWSGDLARAVAQALHDWLPDICDNVKPWTSDSDIEAGQRGLNSIEKELAGSQFGIIVVTQENLNAPWLNFEAGALSKVITTDTENRVAPLLVDISGPSQITSPLNQFQAKVLNKQGVEDLVRSIASAANANVPSAIKRFNAFWSELDEKVAAAKATHGSGVEVPPREVGDMVEEMLGYIRAMRAEQENAKAWRDIVSARPFGSSRPYMTFGSPEALPNWNQLLESSFAHGAEFKPTSEVIFGAARLKLEAEAIQLGLTIRSIEVSMKDDDHQFVVKFDPPADQALLEAFQDNCANDAGIAILAENAEG